MHNGDMAHRVGIVVAWLVATIVAIGIAATAVGSVRGQVTDVPAIPAAGTSALLEPTTTTSAPGPTTTTSPGIVAPETTTTVASSAPTTAESTTTTTVDPPSTTTTTAPPPATTTTTTTPPANPELSTHQLVGGQVTISALAPNVTLVGAVPSGGFSAEVEDSGPGEVEVEFESSHHKSTFRARWEDGHLDIDIDEESEEGEEGGDD